MELKQLQAELEAVLFAHAEPLSAPRLAEILEAEEELIDKLLVALRDSCSEEARGIQLIRLENGWQFATKQRCGDAVKRALDHRRNAPLSPAALEVLAIIAYNQPVSRSFIEQVRGVDSSTTVATLVEKGLISETGRLNLPGRPIAFGTTDAFLRAFGLSSLTELPPLHSEEQEDESALYALPPEDMAELEVDDQEVSHALRGGGFIEAEGGAAALVGEDE